MSAATAPTDDAAVAVHGLRKAYGEHEVLRGISFSVARGEVLGFLGPNGAGKSTTIEILEGSRPRSGGDVSVLGFDPARRPRELRARMASCSRSPSSTRT